MQDIGAAGENEFSFQRVSAVSGRFKVLKDKRFSFPITAAANNAAATTVSWSFPRLAFDFTYAPKVPLTVNVTSSNATPAVAGLVTCNIFLLAYAGNFNGVAALNIQAASRTYYCD